MGKYVFAYRGGNDMAPTPEEQAKVMEAWGAFAGQLGPAIVDFGNPFGASQSTSKSGAGDTQGLGGFSVITAESLDAAVKMAQGCPIYSEGGTIDVYECLEIEM